MNTLWIDRLAHERAHLGTERGSEPLCTKRRLIAVQVGLPVPDGY